MASILFHGFQCNSMAWVRVGGILSYSGHKRHSGAPHLGLGLGLALVLNSGPVFLSNDGCDT